MAATVTPTPLQGPTAKEKKYDRQLRLWAANGQQALEEAHVLLLNNGSGVVGIETLKNLVLPGVGNFTIVDVNVVTEEDLGVNFFLDEASLGKNRGAECCKFLEELNPEVQGLSIQESADEFLKKTDLSQYALILLVSPAKLERELKSVSDAAWKLSIPLFYIHSVGFYTHFSVQLPSLFPIVDTHPDPASTQDLRLLAPWPELLDHMKLKTAALESMKDHDHGHVPYLLLLLHYLETWSTSHDGKYPQNYTEKTQFRDMVGSGMRRNSAEGAEENFEEATAAVLKALNFPTIPSGLKEIFNETECRAPSPTSADFWLIANAVQAFASQNSILPLPGAVPDMKALSKDYIALQNVYRAKAHKDLATVTESVRNLEAQLGRSKIIDSKDIEAFCKGAAFVKLVRGRKLRCLDAVKGIDLEDRVKFVTREIGDPESLLSIYIALTALDLAIDQLWNNRIPSGLTLIDGAGAFTGNMEVFVDIIFKGFKIADPEADFSNSIAQVLEVAKEIQRSGPYELHNISSLAGGVVAQEAIKVITRQYVPVDNTCIIDGITSKSAVFRL